jgi:hypothetical protein
MRTRAVIMLVANDDVDGPQLWKVDPSGLAQGWKVGDMRTRTCGGHFVTQGAACGEKESEAVANLEKRLKKKVPESENETIQVCVVAAVCVSLLACVLDGHIMHAVGHVSRLQIDRG